MKAWQCALLILTGCGGSPSASSDAPGDGAAVAPPWVAELPPAVSLGVRRGLTPTRAILHLHSPYSHDACDGEPRDPVSGAVDEACLADLRAGLCRTRIDVAALSDHDDSMADVEFATLMLARGNDTPIVDQADRVVGNLIACADGHQVATYVGAENDLMPLLLDQHVAGTVEERHQTYNGTNATATEAMRQAGAVLWIPHTEQKSLADLEAWAPSGLEVYQLHANLDPDIRRDYLGLDPAGAIAAAAAFFDTSASGPEPDLALMSFLSANQPALAAWDHLLASGQRVAGSGGSDAHQNALPLTMRDGERGDSYRRVMRWFANVVLTDDSGPEAFQAGLAAGRMWVGFELFGSPVGFDVVARAGDTTWELGGQLAVSDAATLHVSVPLVPIAPGLVAPTVRHRVIRVDANGATDLGWRSEPQSEWPLDQAGAYRVEVEIVPRHLAPYLGSLGPALSEQAYPWIYASPIYVTAGA